ncbi:MAG: hypothetical protein KA716_28345 [Gloeotrichia echinulata DEX184]|nr:hypothetical protein [Gloeotrichia echinulata DEX184]
MINVGCEVRSRNTPNISNNTVRYTSLTHPTRAAIALQDSRSHCMNHP